MELPVISDYRALFLQDRPLLDVRAPVEFARGAFPCAVNHPLIDDEERHQIGIAYKQSGQDAAIELGHQLVHGARRDARTASWDRFARQHPQGALYCFRGGLRSQVSQRWLYEHSGIEYPRVHGGYKALRAHLIESLQGAADCLRPILIGGRTGVGKTRLLERLPRAVDLERLAWHRGSAFGRHATPQPSQIDFENALAVALLKLRAQGSERVVVEDEGRNVGSVKLPDTLHARFKQGELLVLEASLSTRVQITLREYVVDALAEYRHAVGETHAFEAWSKALQDSLERIRRRLGGDNHARIRQLMNQALERHQRYGDLEPHSAWIQALLTDYYDPMYDYQLSRHPLPVGFRGEAAEVEARVHALLEMKASTPASGSGTGTPINSSSLSE
ncbi:MAG: tRNA 2-selenouridine(34) synthase MnmH [Gammaproteobacteria bacterium]|nr:tRNA 2-selenouridine(34) synthase MnmH [Gammaproteobacteria bacterium]